MAAGCPRWCSIAATRTAWRGFYSELLGLPVTRVAGDWVDIGDGQIRLSFQHAPDHQPPRWPDPDFPQQVHLDIRVRDIAAAEARVLALGQHHCQAPNPVFGSTPTQPVTPSASHGGSEPCLLCPAPPASLLKQPIR